MTSKSPQLRDYVTRTKAPSPLGTSIFVALRLLDPPLIWAILAPGIASNLISALGFSPPALDTNVNYLGLSPAQAVIFLMATAGSLKHVFWILFVSEQQMPTGSGLLLGSLELISDALNSILFVITGSSSSGIESWTFIAGISLYTVGLFLETVSEIQRRNFKRMPANRGKPYADGLFSWARNINYGGHTLWKSGFAMVSGGWIWALVIGGTYFYDFASRGVPVLDQYCHKRVSFPQLIMLEPPIAYVAFYIVWRSVDGNQVQSPLSTPPWCILSALYYLLLLNLSMATKQILSNPHLLSLWILTWIAYVL